jgi:hypothetical protein
MKRQVFTTVMSIALVAAGHTHAAQKKHFTAQRFPFTPGASVVVDVASLNVHMRSSDVFEVEVITDLKISGVNEERAAAWIDRHMPVTTSGDDGILVKANPGREGFLGLGLLTARARLRVVTPATASPDITTTDGNMKIEGDFPRAAPLRLRTATGGMDFAGATRELEIRSASGDARIDLIRPVDKLFARTSSGDVTLEGGARSVEIDTASGDVRLRNLSGSARVGTSNGGVMLHFDRLDPSAQPPAGCASFFPKAPAPGAPSPPPPAPSAAISKAASTSVATLSSSTERAPSWSSTPPLATSSSRSLGSRD